MLRAAGSIVGLVAAAALGAVATFWFTGPTVTKQNDSQKEYDASQLPFTASVQPESDEPLTWKMVLDRELTAEETRTMTSKEDSSSVFSYLRSLGGRPMAYAQYLENAPAAYREKQSSGVLELTDAVKLNLLSARAYGVVIDDWEAVDVRCAPSTAKTVVSYPPQGEASYTGIRMHLPPLASEPVLIDEGEGQGEPYFNNRYIELGGGQSPAGLRVEAIAPPGQSCEWGVKVHYVDALQNEQEVLLADSKGNPLRIRTDSVPANPRQRWVFGAVPWTPCHENPQGELCEL